MDSIEGVQYPKLNVEEDTSLETLDLEQARLDRMERNRLVMKALDAGITDKMYPQIVQCKSEKEEAAITIQKTFRGYQGRKIYINKLFDHFTEEERKQRYKMERQMEEGQLLIENHQLEVLLDDDQTTRRNRVRHYIADVITIQRAWRTYVKKKGERILPSQDDIDDTEKDKGTEKGNSAPFTPGEVCNSDKSSPVSVLKDIESASFVNDRSISTSDFKLVDDTATYNVGIVITNDNDSETENTNIYLSGTTSHSTPEENTQSHSHDSTPEDDRVYSGYHSPSHNLLGKVKGDSDVDCVSIASDYSEVSVPLRELAESEVEIVQRTDLSSKHFYLSSASSGIQRNPDETEEEFNRRLRKINYLSIAQEFAELKKINANALPLGLHRDRDCSSSGESSKQSSEMNTPNEATLDVNAMFSDLNNDVNCNALNRQSELSSKATIQGQNDNEVIKSKTQEISPNSKEDHEGDFDVYNIETALPNLDWDTLERQLQQATNQQIERQEAQRNDREEIRKKLAMTAEVDEDNFNEDKPYKKSSSRVLTGKNLQICFMNEDQDQEDQPHVAIDTSTEKPQEPPKTHLDCKTNSNENSVSTERRPDEDDEDFFKRQARLQKEAKIALAQASTMAHMQLEVERQKKKASPIAEIVGIPYIGDNRRQRVGLKLMYEMNVAQLQVVVNDLHTQIENLNEELVQLLMERDELHMSQDSMLVDIEDHTRRAEETAVRLNTKQVRQHSKS